MKKKTEMSLQDLLLLKLKALYDIETQIVKALPKMIKKTDDEDLRTAFEEHLQETEVHVARLEEAFALMDIKPAKTKVEAIRGLVNDVEWVMKNVSGPEALDAHIIAAAQYIEHYEIAGYATASEWANLLGMEEISNLLISTLEEERAASQKLSELATSKINELAIADEEDVREAVLGGSEKSIVEEE